MPCLAHSRHTIHVRFSLLPPSPQPKLAGASLGILFQPEINLRGILLGQVGLLGNNVCNHSAFYLVVFEEAGGAAVRSAGARAAWRSPPPLNGVRSSRVEVLGEGWDRGREPGHGFFLEHRNNISVAGSGAWQTLSAVGVH